MKKPRTRAFRRNRRRNTRKIKGGDLNLKQLNTYFSRLPAYLKSTTVDDETKMKVANTLFSEVFKIINAKISREDGGYLVEAQYIIHRKLRRKACGRFAERKTLRQVFRSADCQKEVDEMEILKSKNVQKLEKGKRSKLKGAKELSSRFLARVLMTMMQTYSAAKAAALAEPDKATLHNDIKELAQSVLKMYFTNDIIDFIPDEGIKLEVVLTKEYDPKSLSTTDEVMVKRTAELEVTEEEEYEIVEENSPSQPNTGLQYGDFKNIVGEDTLSKEEFDLLESIHRTKNPIQYGGGFTDLPDMLLTVVLFVGVLSEGIAEAVIVNIFRLLARTKWHRVDVVKRLEKSYNYIRGK